MKRVMVIGQPGSGKSTFARSLGAATGLPVHHMDHIHWMPDWRERSHDEKLRMVRDIQASDAWILEGGFSTTYEERAARADTIVHLDAPVLPRLWRVTVRSIRYWGRARPDLPEGCLERFGWHQVEFYRFILRTRHTSRARIIDLKHRVGPNTRVATLYSFQEQNAFVSQYSGRKRVPDSFVERP